MAALVQLTFQLDPCSPALFVFCNRNRTKLKILEWDEAGFWLHYRRLERGTIQWPARGETATQWITLRQLQWLVDGLALDQPQVHRLLRGRALSE